MNAAIKAHWVCPKKGLLRAGTIRFTPSVGDEVRVNDSLFYIVIRKVWCLDEQSAEGHPRLNIEVKVDT